MRIRFDPFSRKFSNRRVFDDNALRISVDGRPKLIEMYAAFSNENALVLTRPKLNAQFRCQIRKYAKFSDWLLSRNYI